MTGYKINVKNSVALLYFNENQTEAEIMESISLTVTTKKKKTENKSNMMPNEEIEVDSRRCKTTHAHRLEK